jgi:hypothetical protein
MHLLRRWNVVAALSVAVVTLALAAPIARQPTHDALDTSRPVPRASVLDAATEIAESAAVDSAAARSWHRSREPALGIAVAAVAAAVAAAALCFVSRSARERLCSRAVTANGVRAPPRLHA